MKYVLIAAYNAAIEASMPLQCVAEMTDEDLIESHRRAVITNQIPADKAKDLVVFKYGTFEDLTGDIELLDKPVRLCALSQFLPRKKEVISAEDTSNA